MDEGGRVPGLLAADGGARLARMEAGAGRQSHRAVHPRDRRLGAAIPPHHASGHADQQDIEHAAVHALSPDARTVRVLLRMPLFFDLSLARQVFDPSEILPRQRNLWVTDTVGWCRETRLPFPLPD